MEINITGDVPSKKNSRNLFVKNGRIINIPNKRYKDWLDDSLMQCQSLKNAYRNAIPVEKAERVIVTIYPSNKRKFDLDNRLGSIMDFLVDLGIITDDNYTVIPEIKISVGEVRKNNGGCKIIIEF